MISRLAETIFLVAALTFGVVVFLAHVDRAAAHSYDLGYKWFSNLTQYENVLNSTDSDEGWSAGTAPYHWDVNSLLNTNTSSGSYEIEYISGNYGPTNWLGAAYVYSNNYTCLSPSVSPPGGCNKTTEPATTAVLLLNSYWDSVDTIALRPQVTKHELGHPFGLAHNNTSCEGVLMDRGSCTPHAATIQPHDAYLVDLLY